MKKEILCSIYLILIVVFITPGTVIADPGDAEVTWLSEDAEDQQLVHLYFFWSLKCPHCLKARPFIEGLPTTYHWIKVHSLEISQNLDNVKLFQRLAESIDQKASSVPAFFICNTMWVGWDHAAGMGQNLLTAAQNCREQHSLNPDTAHPLPELPLLTSLNTQQLSLPLFTVVIALLDAFNPCAFFILLFLLSLLAHARSRARMLLVGLTFVAISGIVYFMFMAAWLNLFLLIGGMPVITTVAGLLAIMLGGLNAREYFIQKSKVSLSIPDQAKPGLYKRMGNLLSMDRLPLLLIGTVTLAVAVNGYELLCTAGFPMVYTRTLTLHQLDTASYYLYLALYNIIYIIPLLVIVALFTFTLGSKKLAAQQGALLKLLSGIMMLLLGTILIFAPDWLNHAITGIALVVLAVLLVTGINYWKKKSSLIK